MNLIKKMLGRAKAASTQDDTIYSPLKGKVVNLKEVNDPTFSEELMGKGIAIIPEDGRVVAPVAGTITTIFRTFHAIALKSSSGAEVIVHVGLETVNLGGEYFTAHVTDGEQVKVGDLLMEFDMEKIIAAGYDIITPIVVPNSAEYKRVIPTEEAEVNEKAPLLTLTK